MKRFLLLLLVLCTGLLQSPAHAQEPAPEAALQSLNAKLDLILKRMDSIDRRLNELERNHDDSLFSPLRTPDKSRNAGSADAAPLAFHFAFPVPVQSERDGKRIFSGIEDGMRIDALQRRLRW